jgi:hypothetical protein
MLVLPPGDGYGKISLPPNTGIRSNDTIVFVIDIIGAVKMLQAKSASSDIRMMAAADGRADGFLNMDFRVGHDGGPAGGPGGRGSAGPEWAWAQRGLAQAPSARRSRTLPRPS